MTKQSRKSLGSRIALVGLSVYMASCATLPDSSTNDTTTPLATESQQDAVIRSFDRDTLYDLLVAEFAGKRERPDVALGKYLKQAHKTKDPNVIARATHIARYIGAHQAALDAAILWVEVDPTNAQAKEIAATQLIRIGQLNKAMEQVEALLEMDVKVNFEFLLQGIEQADMATRDQVLLKLTQINERHPNHEQLWFTKGAIEHKEKRWESSLESFNKAIELNPNYVNAILAKSNLLAEQGKDQESLAFLKSAAKKQPKNKRIGVTYGRQLIKSQKLAEAQNQFAQLVNYYPNDADLLLSLSLISWENNLLDTAKLHLNRLLVLRQRTEEAHTYLGRIAASENQLQVAIDHYRKILPGPNYAAARVQIAVLQTETEGFAAAYKTLHEAREADATKAVQYYLAEAELLTKEEKLEDAITLLTKALEEHKSDLNLLYSRGMVFEQANQYDAMEADLRQILSKQPENTAALNALGYTFADRNHRLDEAYQLIQKAYKLAPNDPAIMDSLGWIKYRMGDTETALNLLRQAYSAFDDHEIAAHLGEVLWQAGNQQEALTIWKKALQKDPKSPVIQRVMERFLKQ